MAKLTRVYQKLFGASANPGEVSKFGSMAAGTKEYSLDVEEMQELANWLGGWFSAVTGEDVPSIEDMNAVLIVAFYQICYLLQTGIQEWNTDTTYFIGSLVNDGFGRVYRSIADDNAGNALTDQTKWTVDGGRSRTVVADTAILSTDDIIRSNTSVSGGSNSNLLHTLPPIASWVGQKRTVMDKGDGTYYTEVKGNGAETINGTNLWEGKLQKNESMTFYNNGTTVDTL